MDCEDFEEWLSDYEEDALDSASREILQGHLRFCPRCSDTLKRMRQVQHALCELGRDRPPAGFQLRLDCRLHRAFRRRSMYRRSAWGLAAVIALLAVLWPETGVQQSTLAQSFEEDAAIAADDGGHGQPSLTTTVRPVSF